MSNRGRFLVGILFLALWAANIQAQSLFATLTGIVSDSTGAVVPGAKVTLRNEGSSSTRDTVTDNDGYFTFASVSVGNFTYEVTVEAKGFSTYKGTGIALLGGEKRNVNITMALGSTSETVTVAGTADLAVPVDSGEKSSVLTTKELENYIQVGSNAAEYIKIMPGFGIQNGTSNKANYTGEVIGINANGDAGSQSPLNNAYSYNGMPANSLDITADGAHVSDPGCNCDTPVNPNSEMVSEFKVLTSNFSAENQKGPAVISSVAKSGGSQFHGSGFFSARNYTMNANDALFNANGTPKPANEFYFPGGTIGGPVLIPKTNFNKNRDKLFFFTGYEYYYQVLDTGLLRATVPTAGMLNGDFSPASIAQLGSPDASGGPPGQLNARGLALCPGGMCPASAMNPNTLALMKQYPAPNSNPASTGGYNYVNAEVFNQNNWQWMTRVDYNISDNTKLFVRYNLQHEVQQFPVGLWWRQTDQVPYPTPVQGKNSSQSTTASITHVFSPTMTNETVLGFTYVGFPNVFEDPAKVNRTNVGYNYTGVYHNGVAQIPSFGGNGWQAGTAALIFNPGGFEAGGNSAGLYADKWLPSVSDTFTVVKGTHTIKAGAFYEWIKNAQPANGNSNGYMTFSNSNNFTLGNAYADMYVGNINTYNEANFNNINNISYQTLEFFAQDSWKVNKRLTIDYGLRATHFTPWIDRTGNGYSIFNEAAYSPTCAPAPTYCGFQWHKIDPSVPIGGFPTRFAFWQPRVGFAYDINNGNTVLRGGWGSYYYHSGQFTTGLSTAAGVQNINIGPGNGLGVPLFASQLDTYPPNGTAASPGAVTSTDNNQPYTYSYSVTLSQRLPWSSLLEVAYVGNHSYDGLQSNGPGADINTVPYGAMLGLPGDPNSLNANLFRPLLGYGQIGLATNNTVANYNALQTTWVRSKGNYSINLNYTYGKSLGTVNPALDPYNLQNDYGVQAGNRKQIFNAAYSVVLPSPTKNKIAGGFINGWQVSGITQWESGQNLTGNSGGNNFSMSTNNAKIPGTTYNISNVSLLGTPDMQLNPILTCNPAKNLGPNQYINDSCFALPSVVGQNGGSVLPAIYGPAFFNWDLGLFKNFQIKESMKLQFRVDGYNFLNHPLWSFNGSNLGLSINPATLQAYPTCNGTNASACSDFGEVTQKQGHRIIQLSVHFYF
ncbi:MAG: carboxypeptidase-like regulatory domain-containing protein [Bryobacteraceae bacterium]